MNKTKNIKNKDKTTNIKNQHQKLNIVKLLMIIFIIILAVASLVLNVLTLKGDPAKNYFQSDILSIFEDFPGKHIQNTSLASIVIGKLGVVIGIIEFFYFIKNRKNKQENNQKKILIIIFILEIVSFIMALTCFVKLSDYSFLETIKNTIL